MVTQKKRYNNFLDMNGGQRGLANPPTDFLTIYSPQDKNLNWNQVKRKYPGMNPQGDEDGDGYPNAVDCKPLDPQRDGVFEAIGGAISGAVSGVKNLISGDKRRSSFGESVSKGWRTGMRRPSVIKQAIRKYAPSAAVPGREAKRAITQLYQKSYLPGAKKELQRLGKRGYVSMPAQQLTQVYKESLVPETIEQIQRANLPKKTKQALIASAAAYKKAEVPVYKGFTAAQRWVAMQHPTLGPKIRRASRISRLMAESGRIEQQKALAQKQIQFEKDPAKIKALTSQITGAQARQLQIQSQLATTREKAGEAGTVGRARRIKLVSSLGKQVFPMMGSRSGLQIPTVKSKSSTGKRGRPVGSYSARWAAYGGVIKGRKARSIAKRQAYAQQQRMIVNPQYRRQVLNQLRQQQLRQQIMAQQQAQQAQMQPSMEQQMAMNQAMEQQQMAQRQAQRAQYLNSDEIAQLQEIQQQQQQAQMQQQMQAQPSYQMPQELNREPPMSAFAKDSMLPGFRPQDRMQAGINNAPLQPGEYIDSFTGQRRFRPLPKSEKWILPKDQQYQDQGY